MAKFKKTLIPKSGHLVDKTIGSTNEISFSVLDKAKKDVDYGGKETAPWSLDEKRVAEQKKKRTGKIRRKALLITLLIGASIIAILLAISTFVQINTGSLGTLKHDINDAISTYDKGSNLLALGNKLVNDECGDIASTDFLKNFDSVKQEIEKEAEEANKLKEKIAIDLKEIATPGDVEAGNNALDMLDKQVRLLDDLKNNMDDAKPFVSEFVSTTNAMNSLMNGDSKSREATSLLNNANVEDARKSIQASDEAITQFEDAKFYFESAKDVGTKEFDYSDYVSYCNLRIEAENAGKTSAQAYIDRNKETLDAENAIYNDKLGQATEIANNWKEKPFEQVGSKYKDKFSGKYEAWNSEMSPSEKFYKEIKLYIERNS